MATKTRLKKRITRRTRRRALTAVAVATALPEIGFVRLPVVLAHVALGKSTLWEMVKQQKFPPPIRLSERAVAWNVADVRGWIAGRIAASHPAAAPERKAA